MSGIKVNGSLTITELKKPHPSRLVGGAQMWNRLKIQEGCLRSEEGVPAPHQGPQPRVPVLGSQVPTTSGCENHWGLSQQRKLLET